MNFGVFTATTYVRYANSPLSPYNLGSKATGLDISEHPPFQVRVDLSFNSFCFRGQVPPPFPVILTGVEQTENIDKKGIKRNSEPHYQPPGRPTPNHTKSDGVLPCAMVQAQVSEGCDTSGPSGGECYSTKESLSGVVCRGRIMYPRPGSVFVMKVEVVALKRCYYVAA